MHRIFGEKENKEYFTRRGAYLIPVEDGKVFVMKVSKGYFLIGGGKENEESDEETIIRECREETGYIPSIGQKICSGETYCHEYDLGCFHPVQTYYSGKLITKVGEPLEENHTLVSFSFNEIEGKMYSPMQQWAISQAIEKEVL